MPICSKDFVKCDNVCKISSWFNIQRWGDEEECLIVQCSRCCTSKKNGLTIFQQMRQ